MVRSAGGVGLLRDIAPMRSRAFCSLLILMCHDDDTHPGFIAKIDTVRKRVMIAPHYAARPNSLLMNRA